MRSERRKKNIIAPPIDIRFSWFAVQCGVPMNSAILF